MKNLNSKVKHSETKVLLRSKITPAPYNPRKISEDARKMLKRNIRKNGIIGGMVWNEQTSNLVSGHQKLSIADEINKYNPETKENDYEIKVEVINVDLKKEKELNIFFNSSTAQGEWDNDILAQLIPDIDTEEAGLDATDINILMADVPVFDIAEYNQAIKNDFDDLERLTKEDQARERELRKQAVKEAKQATKDKMKDEVEGETWVTLSFQSYENKILFMEAMNQPIDNKYIKGEEVAEKILYN